MIAEARELALIPENSSQKSVPRCCAGITTFNALVTPRRAGATRFCHSRAVGGLALGAAVWRENGSAYRCDWWRTRTKEHLAQKKKLGAHSTSRAKAQGTRRGTAKRLGGCRRHPCRRPSRGLQSVSLLPALRLGANLRLSEFQEIAIPVQRLYQ